VSDRTVLLDGVRVPRFLYGTAWKEDRTQPLTELALRQGFRGVDTANQRRHYHEAAVGRAVAAAMAGGLAARDELFLQTKFISAPARTTACRTTRRRPPVPRSSSRSPAHWNT
jgi:diketogulonate reductase-like aldo/keto reductase